MMWRKTVLNCPLSRRRGSCFDERGRCSKDVIDTHHGTVLPDLHGSSEKAHDLSRGRKSGKCMENASSFTARRPSIRIELFRKRLSDPLPRHLPNIGIGPSILYRFPEFRCSDDSTERLVAFLVRNFLFA